MMGLALCHTSILVCCKYLGNLSIIFSEAFVIYLIFEKLNLNQAGLFEGNFFWGAGVNLIPPPPPPLPAFPLPLFVFQEELI